jgi:steroid delta-isomerase-like uncharacterized protein
MPPSEAQYLRQFQAVRRATMDQHEANKRVVAQYVEALNNGDIETLRKIFAPDSVVQGVLGKGHLEAVEPIWRMLHDSLQMHLTIDAMIAEGDQVAVRYSEHGTFVGPFRGHPPTGKSYDLVAMEWFIVRDGKIRQRWGARDAESQARQIGLPLA